MILVVLKCSCVTSNQCSGSSNTRAPRTLRNFSNMFATLRLLINMLARFCAVVRSRQFRIAFCALCLAAFVKFSMHYSPVCFVLPAQPKWFADICWMSWGFRTDLWWTLRTGLSYRIERQLWVILPAAIGSALGFLKLMWENRCYTRRRTKMERMQDALTREGTKWQLHHNPATGVNDLWSEWPSKWGTDHSKESGEIFWFQVDPEIGSRKYFRHAMSGKRGAEMIMDARATPPNSRKATPQEIANTMADTESTETINTHLLCNKDDDMDDDMDMYRGLCVGCTVVSSRVVT